MPVDTHFISWNEDLVDEGRACYVTNLNSNRKLEFMVTYERDEFDASAWNALFAPRGTPKSALSKLTDALDKALDDENVRKHLLGIGCEVPGKTKRGQQALAALVKSEVARWTSIIKAASN